jgi:hypothetical protein
MTGGAYASQLCGKTTSVGCEPLHVRAAHQTERPLSILTSHTIQRYGQKHDSSAWRHTYKIAVEHPDYRRGKSNLCHSQLMLSSALI